MEATVITPTAGQAVVATEQDCSRDRARLGKLIAAEQAAYGRLASEQHAAIRSDVGDAKFDIVAALDQRHVAAADRLTDASRDLSNHIAQVNDATREGQTKLQLVLSDLRYEQAITAKDLTERIGHVESRMLLELQRQSTEHERRLADARVEALTQHCEIKELIRCEAAKTREQGADFRMRDLEAANARMAARLDFLAKV